MQEQQKRILTILLFLGSVFVMGLVMYMLFFGEAPTTQPPTTQPTPDEQPTGGLTPAEQAVPGAGETSTTEGGALPQAASVADGGVTQTTALTTGPVQNTTLSADGKSVNFYNNDDGHFYTISKDGTIVKLSKETFPDVQTVAWNKSSEKAVLTFPDSSKIIYDFENQSQVTLPSHWDDVSFSPSSNQIIAKSLALDPNNRWLVTANDNGSNVIPIQALGDNADKVLVDWSPNDQVVGFADTAAILGIESASGFDTQTIFPIGKNAENFKGLVIEGFGFQPSWSPSGKTLLYSVYGDYSLGKPLLWLVDGTAASMGNNRHSLGLNTWANKCTWNSDTQIYCAVPQNLPENAGLQPSLYSGLPDTLYKMDLTNNRVSVVAIPENDTTMLNLSVSKDESLLYYTDALTGQLKLIKLK